MLCAG